MVEISNANNDEGKRQNWSGTLEFLLTCISMAVGLGNVWRFPFTAYENGGGAFLIPYVIVLFVIGKPMYYLEALLGQFASKSSISIWAVCPAFLGVGVGQTYAVTAIVTYYSALIAIAFHYIVASFENPLPWSYCRKDWSAFCVDASAMMNNSKTNLKLESSAELYFRKIVLQEYDDISEGIGLPQGPLIIGLFITWLITFFIVIKGVKSLGKVSYFLAIFPYVMLVTLLAQSVSLEGALDGIIYFLRPNWSELLNVKVWKEAVVQCFFSLTVSLGPIMTFSSYNKFDHNIHRDAMIVTTMDAFTSLLAGITIFAVLGNLAHNLNAGSIDEVVRGGTGLAFISYPDAIAKFASMQQLFSVLFFLMISVLGIGTLVALQTTITTVICDCCKISHKNFWKISLAVSLFGFVVGLVYVTPGGQWVLNLVDYYAGNYVVFYVACIESIAIFWIYGVNNFCDDIEFMTNKKVSLYWRICWRFLTPALMVIILIYSLAEMRGLNYNGRSYPLAADVGGWCVLLFGFLQVPFWAIWFFSRNYVKNIKETIIKGLIPTSEWGPHSEEMRSAWLIYKSDLRNPRCED